MDPKPFALTKLQNLDDYKRWPLSKGAQGEVYKWFCAQTKQVLAVKILLEPDAQADDIFFGGVNQKCAEWQAREAGKVMRTNHPRLLRALEVFEYKEGLAIIMPFFELGSLRAIRANESFNMTQKRDAIQQILEGIQELHRVGDIHRDIKPDNVLVASVDPVSVVIGDFGQISVQHPITWTGTDLFRAPEVYHCRDVGKEYSKHVDIYSLGITTLWILGPEVWNQAWGGQFVDPLKWEYEKWSLALHEPIEALIGKFPFGESQDALNAALQMLAWEPTNRPSAVDCLDLAWFRSSIAANAQHSAERARPAKAPAKTKTSAKRGKKDNPSRNLRTRSHVNYNIQQWFNQNTKPAARVRSQAKMSGIVYEKDSSRSKHTTAMEIDSCT